MEPCVLVASPRNKDSAIFARQSSSWSLQFVSTILILSCACFSFAWKNHFIFSFPDHNFSSRQKSQMQMGETLAIHVAYVNVKRRPPSLRGRALTPCGRRMQRPVSVSAMSWRQACRQNCGARSVGRAVAPGDEFLGIWERVLVLEMYLKGLVVRYEKSCSGRFVGGPFIVDKSYTNGGLIEQL